MARHIGSLEIHGTQTGKTEIVQIYCRQIDCNFSPFHLQGEIMDSSKSYVEVIIAVSRGKFQLEFPQMQCELLEYT